MRVGISGTHRTGKTTLAQALCACLPGHVTAVEPYYLLEEAGMSSSVPHPQRITGPCWHARSRA